MPDRPTNWSNRASVCSTALIGRRGAMTPLLACALVLLLGDEPVLGASPVSPPVSSWNRRDVVPKSPGITLTDAYSGRGDMVSVRVLNVSRDNGDRILIRDRGMEGSCPKENFVLLENAIGYFTERIQTDPRDDYAYALR